MHSWLTPPLYQLLACGSVLCEHGAHVMVFACRVVWRSCTFRYRLSFSQPSSTGCAGSREMQVTCQVNAACRPACTAAVCGKSMLICTCQAADLLWMSFASAMVMCRMDFCVLLGWLTTCTLLYTMSWLCVHTFLV